MDTKQSRIEFNRPYMTGAEIEYILAAKAAHRLAGDGPFTAKCQKWLEERTGSVRSLLTHSCTAALEMAALLLDTRPGDEIIMPSFTFVSTANAFVLRGGVPVFVDIRDDTLNLDERLIEAAITPRTRAIVPVHYAGVACEMDAIMEIARELHLSVVEDAAQGAMAKYKGRSLGSIGALGALSFHETKNLISGEGGAILVNDASLVHRAEIIREKGTDRSRFIRGEIDKYTWQEVGSSFLPGEVIAAFLWAQLQQAIEITDDRLASWRRYNSMLSHLQAAELVRLPIIPGHCAHNGHMYYVLLAPGIDRGRVLQSLSERGINAVFHYVPLHSSPAGLKYGRSSGQLEVTRTQAERLIRLPLWVGLSEGSQIAVVDGLTSAIRSQL